MKEKEKKQPETPLPQPETHLSAKQWKCTIGLLGEKLFFEEQSVKQKKKY